MTTYVRNPHQSLHLTQHILDFLSRLFFEKVKATRHATIGEIVCSGTLTQKVWVCQHLATIPPCSLADTIHDGNGCEEGYGEPQDVCLYTSFLVSKSLQAGQKTAKDVTTDYPEKNCPSMFHSITPTPFKAEQFTERR